MNISRVLLMYNAVILGVSTDFSVFWTVLMFLEEILVRKVFQRQDLLGSEDRP